MRAASKLNLKIGFYAIHNNLPAMNQVFKYEFQEL